jgi:hypothetical protein
MGATIFDFAARYHAAGWCVLPIPFREKVPALKAWQTLRLSAAELPDRFGRPTNIGINLGEPSGGLADVDLDAPEVLELASKVLVPTLCFGRASKPRSHWLYTAPGAATAQFRDPLDRSMLVELRATPASAEGAGRGGSQTVVPPSTHPSGEVIRFEPEWKGLPLVIDAAELRERVAVLASAALVMRRLGLAPALAALAGDTAIFETLDPVDLGRIRDWLGLRAELPPPAPRPQPSAQHEGLWIERLRQQHPADVARALGADADPAKGISPCPVCGAETRGSKDKRPAVGFVTSSDGTVLAAHSKCGFFGSSLQVASLLVIQTTKPQSSAQWAQLRERLALAGVL